MKLCEGIGFYGSLIIQNNCTVKLNLKHSYWHSRLGMKTINRC